MFTSYSCYSIQGQSWVVLFCSVSNQGSIMIGLKTRLYTVFVEKAVGNQLP